MSSISCLLAVLKSNTVSRHIEHSYSIETLLVTSRRMALYIPSNENWFLLHSKLKPVFSLDQWGESVSNQ